MLYNILETVSDDPLGAVFKKCYANGFRSKEKFGYYLPVIKGILKQLAEKCNLEVWELNITEPTLYIEMITENRNKITLRLADGSDHQYLYIRKSSAVLVGRSQTFDLRKTNITQAVTDAFNSVVSGNIFETATKDPIGDVFRKCVDKTKHRWNKETNLEWNTRKINYYSNVIASLLNKIIKDNGFKATAYVTSSKDEYFIHFSHDRLVKFYPTYETGGMLVVRCYTMTNKISTGGVVWQVTSLDNLTEMITNYMVDIHHNQINESIQDDPLGTIVQKLGDNWDKLKYYLPAFKSIIEKLNQSIDGVPYKINLNFNDIIIYSMSGYDTAERDIVINIVHNNLVYVKKLLVSDEISSVKWMPNNVTSLTDVVKDGLMFMAGVKHMAKKIFESVVDKDPLGDVYRKCLKPMELYPDRLGWNADKLEYYSNLMCSVVKKLIPQVNNVEYFNNKLMIHGDPGFYLILRTIHRNSNTVIPMVQIISSVGSTVVTWEIDKPDHITLSELVKNLFARLSSVT